MDRIRTIKPWFIARSLALDIQFVKNYKSWGLVDRLLFLTKKYYILWKHIFTPYEFGVSTIRLRGHRLAYESVFGLAGYQSLLVRTSKMLQIGNVPLNVVIDIGANVGLFSLLIQELNPKSRIFAFEPVPETFTILKSNLQDYTNTRMFNTGIGNYKGTASISFNAHDSTTSSITDAGTISINVLPLDAVIDIKKLDLIDLLKIDVESYELHVLQGATNTLARTRFLLIELTLHDNINYTASSLIKLLNSNSFDYQLVTIRAWDHTEDGQLCTVDCLFENVQMRSAR